MTVSIWQGDDSAPVRDVDVLVVGAGVVGCAAAASAADAGHEVVITEAIDAGMGASGRNAGFMISGLDTYYHHAVERFGAETTRELWELSRYTHGLWRRFAEADDVPLVTCGSLLLAESAAEKDDLERAAAALAAHGIDAVYHDRDPLGRGYFAAIEQPLDSAVHPYRLVQAILNASGAELIAANPVYALETIPRGGVLVRSRMWTFHARKVLLCTNAYSPRLHPYFQDKVIPTRAQVLVTEPLPEPLLTTCGYSDYGHMYYRMTFDNRLLIGGGRKQNKRQENDTTEDRTTDVVQSVLEAYARRHFPEVVCEDGSIAVARRWAGIMGFTPDGVPLVGTLPDLPDVGFAVGFTGHGLALGAGTAERAVEHLLYGTHPGAVSVDRLV